MTAPFGKTAILIFTRTDEQEASAKTFVQGIGKNGNQAIARQLIHHAIRTASKIGLPIVVSTSEEQIGETFCERFANTIESVFAKGYENVVAIGNDCPSLTPGLLLDAAQQLESFGLVLGPAMDGGVYLAGISQNDYGRTAFMALPWETPNLQEGFDTYAKTLCTTPVWLAQKADIDNSYDLFAALNRLGSGHPLRRKLAGLLASFQRTIFRYQVPFLSTIDLAANAMRGPPAHSPSSF